jgi:CBS domain
VTAVTDQTRYPEPSDPVQLFVSDDLIWIEPDATLHQVAHRLAAEGVGALIVSDRDRVVGIISERDVVGAAASGKDLDSTTAAELGTSHVVTVALPIAAGVFEPTFGLVLRPEIAALTMSGSSLLVAVNALLLKRLPLPTPRESGGNVQVSAPANGAFSDLTRNLDDDQRTKGTAVGDH